MRAELTAFNRRSSVELRAMYDSEQNEHRPFQVFARTHDDAVIGGVYGQMRWYWLFVDTLWVHEEHRGEGLGRKLLNAIEAEAQEAGAVAAVLDTMDFQARGFYEKNGYRVFGELTNYPLTHTEYHLVKRLR